MSGGESLLAESYEARINQLLNAGLNKEATQLAEIAIRTCPSARDTFSNLYTV